MAQTQPVKGNPWFAVGNRLGDRTLAQQMQGLDRLFAEVEGKTVLDVGCAEGLISIEMVKSGASWVDGVEIRKDAVQNARMLGRSMSLHGDVTFDWGDANEYRPAGDYDIVIMLAVLHKLKNPTAACARLVACAKSLVVIRLPPEHAPTIIDGRSGGEPHHIGVTMERSGFVLEHAACDGPFGEWVGYYRRVRA
jgi:protein-L-isoaspartate O-methyltransferase